MRETNHFLLFRLNSVSYAVNVSAVTRIVSAVEITPLPDSDDKILGVINVAGEITPVINMRRLMGLPSREMELSDHFILIQEKGKSLALMVDKAEDVVKLSGRAIPRADGTCDSISSVATVSGEIVLIQNIATLASAADKIISETRHA